MEKSWILISSRNINPIPCMIISVFNIRNLPPSRIQFSLDKIKWHARRRPKCTICCSTVSQRHVCEPSRTHRFAQLLIRATSHAPSEFMQSLVLLDLDPATAKLVIGFLGPFLSAFGFLFIARIIMSWYPKLPVEKFPYVVAYAPIEPLLVPTRKLIPPLGGVDATPVVCFGLISFISGTSRAACSFVSTSLAVMLCRAMRTLKIADLHFLERVFCFGILYVRLFIR